MSLPLPPPDDADAPVAHEEGAEHDGGDVERTAAIWHPGMSRANHIRLLRLLFDPPPDGDDDGGNCAPGGRAA